MAPATKVVRRTARTPQKVHPLDALIPDPWFAEDYVSRLIGGVVDLEIVHIARQTRDNIILRGPTGSAKTSLVYAAAAGATSKQVPKMVDGEPIVVNKIDPNRRRPLVSVPCNGAIEPGQLLGRWAMDETGKWKFHPGSLTLACMYGGIVYLDEVNFMPARIGAVLHGALDKRRTIYIQDAEGSDFPTQFKCHPDTQFIAAYNPDYEGTRPLNEAFANRFSIPMNFDYDGDVEKKLVMSTSLLAMAAKLRDSYRQGHLRTPISTNKLIELETFCAMEELGFAFAMENFLAHFAEEERQAVKRILELHATGIQQDLFDFVDVDGADDDTAVDEGEPF